MSDVTQDEMAQRLKAAGKKVERAKTERQARAVKGGHLTQQLMAMVAAEGLEQEEKSGFFLVRAPGRVGKLYVAKKGGRVDLAFSLEAEGIRVITEEEARARHLGKVRGQVDFDRDDDTVLGAFASALAALRASPEASARPARPARTAPADEPEGDVLPSDEATAVDADAPGDPAGQ